eukprot:SAG31_NODE_5150_length_2713_cov_2.298776_3_plen_184_part_00
MSGATHSFACDRRHTWLVLASTYMTQPRSRSALTGASRTQTAKSYRSAGTTAKVSSLQLPRHHLCNAQRSPSAPVTTRRTVDATRRACATTTRIYTGRHSFSAVLARLATAGPVDLPTAIHRESGMHSTVETAGVLTLTSASKVPVTGAPPAQTSPAATGAVHAPKDLWATARRGACCPEKSW